MERDDSSVGRVGVLNVGTRGAAGPGEVLIKILEGLPEERNCPCPQALDGLKLPISLP